MWAPAPFSLTSRVAQKKAELTDATDKANAVTEMESQVRAVQGAYSRKQAWVGFVGEAAAYPEQWVTWFQKINKWIPGRSGYHLTSPAYRQRAAPCSAPPATIVRPTACGTA